MNVLFVNKYYAPDIGGVETIVQQFAERLAGAHRVTMLVCKRRFSMRTTVRTENGVRIVRCSSFGTFISMPVSISFLVRFLAARPRHDVIHFNEPFPLATLAALLPKLRRNLYVVSWHCDIVRQRFLGAPVRILQRRLLTLADAVTTNNERLASGSPVLRRFRDKAQIIPASIDAEKALAPRRSVSWNPALPEEFFLFLGRFSYYKGILVLLRAMETIHSRMPLVIAGSGSLAADIRQAVRRGRGNVVLIDRELTEDEKGDLFRRCRFYVFPSIFSSEAFGITQLEAMIQGKPVINTSLPTGVPWVSLDGVTGITVSPGDVDALAAAIDALCGSVDLVERLGQNAARRVLKLFDDRVTLPKIEAVYRRLEAERAAMRSRTADAAPRQVH